MRRTEKAAIVSSLASAAMAAAMLSVGAVSGSVAIIAMGIDSSVDIFASAAVFAGLRLSERHTRNFPAGLYKLENLIAVAIGIMILFTAYELVRESIDKIVRSGEKLEMAWLVIAVMAASTALVLWVARYKRKVGMEENSPSLVADAERSWGDVISGIAVMVGVALAAAGVPDMDAIAGLVVALYLAWTGVQVGLEGLRVLLDVSMDKDILELARSAALATPGVREVREVLGRNSGSYRFITISVVPSTFDMREAGELSRCIKSAVEDAIEKVDRVRVELVKEGEGRSLWAVPLLGDGLTVPGRFDEAASFAFLELDAEGDRVLSREEAVNPYAGDPGAGAVKTVVFLALQGVDFLATRESLRGSAAACVLEENGVKISELPGIVDLPSAERALTALK
ncbi:MAG: cation diffusion facilitator family transporter [Actinobacteria bacterium]|jgi:cation diffusion facilitator family transporter|nr:MAG: cation diffusion facilitator family transporter [Actinomycetota bacterium]